MGTAVHADVAVVGAGITGLSIAWHLAELSAGDVVVFERTAVGSGASGVQPGGVRQQWASRANCVIARESYTFYCELRERLSTGLDAVLEPCGYLFLAQTDDALQQLEIAVSLQNDLDIPSRILVPDEVSELVPGLAVDGVRGASYCHEDGYFNKPLAVIESFGQAARRSGALVEETGVRTLAQAGDGWRLELEDGRSAHASHVVVAGGYESAALLESVGLTLPIVREARYLFYSDPIRERLLEPLVVSTERQFAAKQLADGCVLASDLGAEGDPDAEVVRWKQRIRVQIAELLPILEYVSFPTLVQGFYDLTPDSQPILGSLPGLEGLWLAAGFSGRGFMIAPAVGRLLAEAIVDGSSRSIPPEFRHDRFERPPDSVELLVV